VIIIGESIMKVNIAALMMLLIVGSTWLVAVKAEEPSLAQIVFYVS
jgi:hypothetical protein